MGVLPAEAAKQVHERVAFEVKEAVAFAEASPMPPESTLLEDVYTVMGGVR
jgi:TPP-dependent pyruvate/acetoin dehydrogenase alpha subunit